MPRRTVLSCLLLAAALPAGHAAEGDLPGYPTGVRNTEDVKNVPLAPAEALKLITVPEGFSVSLFAGEPDVAQPISFSFDDRGRLWVAENYSYEGSSGPWKSPVRDRILILADADNDGRFDTRTVFTEQARNLTSVLPGFGGIWACSTPQVVFYPDRDGDDKPDGEPVVVLDGWNDGPIGHCVVNGLQWGPDGWLYGNQGIQGESKVGKPGASDAERISFKGGIWRYHPVRQVFEVVCEGTTNPWGLDFDDHGQGFFTNCVIGHLWHMIPGAHYERMYGTDGTPNTYQLLKACSDHTHWAGKDWQASRDGAGETDTLGGGHAHAGAMVYLGDNWPASYRNSLFTANLHGRRLNNDRLERVGSGYVGRHGADFMKSGDTWFKGLSMQYGPDGGVFVSDWSDVGECHDNKSVHRTSGRIFKVVHGAPRPAAALDLAKLPDAELAALQLHANDWHVRHARRLLQERAASGTPPTAAHVALRAMLADHPDVTRKLRALWALHASGGIDDAALVALLDSPEEHLRAWAVRLLVESRQPSDAAITRFATLAAAEPSPLVRLFLASSLQRVPLAQRWDIAAGLVSHAADASDANQPLMVWYAIEPLAGLDAGRTLKLAAKGKIPTLLKFMARRSAAAGSQ